MLQEDFIGSWHLIDYVTQLADGTAVEPLGAAPYGLGTYTGDGWMSAHLMRRDRLSLGSARPALDRIAPDLLVATAAGYIGYAGRYTVDAVGGRVIHHVETAFLPDWIGTDMIREYRFADGILTLRPPAVGGAASVLRWRRAC
ncbi:lipocalin-like domain-containing protein [Sphingopyxis lindanitolerans]|nr:lipocalin-like domain-containing protein [Sphingopyxis lindanitolerans]